MRIIIWVHKYEPSSGVGSRRWRKFARYLSLLGHKIWIVAPPEKGKFKSEDLSTGSNSLNVIKIGSKLKYYNLFLSQYSKYYERLVAKTSHIFFENIKGFFDHAEAWAMYTAPKIKKLIKELKIEALIVSGHPCSLNYWASILKSDLPNLKLIQDFRDTWNDEVNYSIERFSKSLKCKERSVIAEKIAIQHADLVLNISEDQSNRMKSNNKKTEKKFKIITNGYDPEDYKIFNNLKLSKTFTLIHAGTIRWHAIEGLKKLFLAMREMEEELIEKKFMINFYGTKLNFEEINDFRRIIEKFCRFHNFLKTESILEKISGATAGLIIFDKETGYGTKIFDYIGQSKPFFAICPPGELQKFCKKNNMPTASFNSESIRNALLELLKIEKLQYDIGKKNFESFSIPNITLELNQMISNI
ncbi:hypothetical protein [uncultured Desulfosarcina sp.]|uniref:hypothetical protein n=1 Tax=uncultured Desulfosarcina sp. TaxID=218289 RepID=UPI0029C8D98F|nr:hypothetical protein [uncultured Desulfosarcina sp.]